MGKQRPGDIPRQDAQNALWLNESAGIKRIVGWYNGIANLFWSVLNITPVWLFYYRHAGLTLVYVSLAVSLLAVFIPRRFLDSIQLGKTTAIYRKMGVHLIKRYTQNGELINDLVRKKFPQYNVVSASKQSINKLRQQTYMFEKFHFMMFAIFSIAIVSALAKNYWAWALVIFLCNLLYNIYPILLQQYIRVRLAFSRRRTVG